MGWPAISPQIADNNNEECYTPPSRAESAARSTPNYEGKKKKKKKRQVVQFAVKTFNNVHRPSKAAWIALFRLTYYKQYVQQRLRYQMQMTLADTNCRSETEWLNAACSFIPNTASI